MSKAAVAVDGRRREIDDEYAELRKELAACRDQHARQMSVLDETSAKLRNLFSENDSLQSEALRRNHVEMEEMKTSEAELTMRVGDLTAAKDALTLECTSLREKLEAVHHETFQLKSQLGSKEQTLALELSLKRKAEARNEHLQSELCALESRYAKQGTHVQLLLREKERLWSQLNRSRAASDSTRKESCKEPQADLPKECQAKVQTSSLRISRESSAKVRTSSAVAELERKLWHTQKAWLTNIVLFKVLPEVWILFVTVDFLKVGLYRDCMLYALQPFQRSDSRRWIVNEQVMRQPSLSLQLVGQSIRVIAAGVAERPDDLRVKMQKTFFFVSQGKARV